MCEGKSCSLRRAFTTYVLLEEAAHHQINLAMLEWHQYKAPVCHEGSQDKQNDTNANI
jgi:hypothetical protein